MFIFLLGKIKSFWTSLNIYYKSLIIIVSTFLYSCLFHFGSLFNPDRVLFNPIVNRMLVISGCSMFFCVLIISPYVQKLFLFAPLIRIGRICYSIYLVHMMLLICFVDYFMQRLHAWFAHPTAAYLWVIFTAYMFTTITISLITFEFIEKPLNSLGIRISEKTGFFFKK